MQFNAPPDANSLVNRRSVVVTRGFNNTLVEGRLPLVPDNTTARWVAAIPGAAGLTPDRYRITVKGSDTTPITSQGASLDGEPSRCRPATMSRAAASPSSYP